MTNPDIFVKGRIAWCHTKIEMSAFKNVRLPLFRRRQDGRKGHCEDACAKSTGRQKSKQIYSVILRLDPRIKHAL